MLFLYFLKLGINPVKKHEIQEFIKINVNADFLQNTLELLNDCKKLSDEYILLKRRVENVVLKEAQVIFCTCTQAGSKRIKTRRIKQCIIDECAMCVESETLLPMTLSEKIILYS